MSKSHKPKQVFRVNKANGKKRLKRITENMRILAKVHELNKKLASK